MVKGLVVVILFIDGTQKIVENVFSCSVNWDGYVELSTANEEYNSNIVFNKKAETWVSVADKSDLVFEYSKCIGWKRHMLFGEVGTHE
jgi:hypothetical protein